MRLSTKSKFFVISSDELDDEYELELDGISVQRVDEYKYLGYVVRDDVDYAGHVEARLEAAQRIQT